jgi:hypothetical protein
VGDRDESPFLLLAGGLTGWAIYRNLKDAHSTENLEAAIESKRAELLSLVKKRRYAGAQAAILWHYSACADELVRILDERWHH